MELTTFIIPKFLLRCKGKRTKIIRYRDIKTSIHVHRVNLMYMSQR